MQKNKGGNLSLFFHGALAAVINYHWRGKVRERENLFQQRPLLFADKHFKRTNLPEHFQNVKVPEGFTLKFSDPDQTLVSENPASTEIPNCLTGETKWGRGVDFNKLINDYETQLIIKAMRRTGGNKKEAAKLLNLKRTTLLKKIKKKVIEGMWEELSGSIGSSEARFTFAEMSSSNYTDRGLLQTKKRGLRQIVTNPLIFLLVHQEGVEPPTSWFVAKRSIQLSYWCIGDMLYTPLPRETQAEYSLQCEKFTFPARAPHSHSLSLFYGR